MIIALWLGAAFAAGGAVAVAAGIIVFLYIMANDK